MLARTLYGNSYTFGIEEAAAYDLASPYVYEQVSKHNEKRDISFKTLKPNHVKQHPFEVWKDAGF